jgi:histidine triad (HIT) family protein
MEKDCLICRKHKGEISIPGGVIYQDDRIYLSHSPIQENETDHYLGHIFLETKRHVSGISELTEPEAQAVGLFTTRIADALRRVQGMEHIYSFVIGDGVPHVHVHVIGRYPNAPREYWGINVDEWPDAPRGGEEEIATVADRIRDYLREKYGL